MIVGSNNSGNCKKLKGRILCNLLVYFYRIPNYLLVLFPHIGCLFYFDEILLTYIALQRNESRIVSRK